MAGRRSAARWRDWREWQHVHAGLFSSDIYEQQRAISRVAAWRSRGEVPVSVNATAQLVEIALHEQMANHQHHAVGVSARSHMELSLAYAAAIVRCVNGLVDGSQKGTYAVAVSALAQRIGIPLWIVDLRHESTHNQLPSLPVLRFAAEHLLAWLRSNYWSKQEEVLRESVRITGAVLLERLSPIADSGTNREVTSAPPLKDTLDAEKLRDTVIPLLVQGHQYEEAVFPTGALFHPKFLPQFEPSKRLNEADALSMYPRDELLDFVIELQSLSPSLSARLLSAMSEKVIQSASIPEHEVNSVEVELSLFWIKMIVSNEWRERLKYAEGPIENIYKNGARVFAFTERVLARGDTHNMTYLERLRATLRACKGVRNHAFVTAHTTVRKQLDTLSDVGWFELNSWSSSPLGQHIDSESDGTNEYLLEIDQDSAGVYTNGRPDTEMDEDEGIDSLMESLDADYDRDLAEAIQLEHAVHDQVIHGSHASSNQKVLPQQEVERIQNEIEIW